MPPGASDVPIDIGERSFSQSMLGLAPFETEPAIAVALSGGPDSMALLLLLDRWVRARGGSVVALTVDHGLRPEAAAEAAQLGAWATARGIVHETLHWTGGKPATGIQAAARDARYRLLTEACAARGILHLAFAHHADDQAETVLFRAERGSGPDGLAGMAAGRSLGAARLIRPLLRWPKAALIATCQAFAQTFFEDPSNLSDRYARTGLRRRLAADAAQGAGLLAQSAKAGLERGARERTMSAILGRIAEIRPDGVVTIDAEGLSALDARQRHAVLSAAVRTAGGQAFAPDADAVIRLDDSLQGDIFAGASLGGCVIRRKSGGLLVCREPRRTAPPVALTPGEWHRWDGRFSTRIASAPDNGAITVGALGFKDYSVLRRGNDIRLQAIVAAGFPALRSGCRLLAVPVIGWAEKDAPRVEQRYLPLWPLSPETFTVVYAGSDIMSV
jgi:tRNA(Ile)-lysidine synthase